MKWRVYSSSIIFYIVIRTDTVTLKDKEYATEALGEIENDTHKARNDLTNRLVFVLTKF